MRMQADSHLRIPKGMLLFCLLLLCLLAVLQRGLSLHELDNRCFLRCQLALLVVLVVFIILVHDEGSC